MAKGMRAQRFRSPLLWLAGVRAVLGIAAIPLAPFLYRKHFVLLVLLRPTKEVLLAAGFQIRRGDASLPTIVASAIPLVIFGVWLFFFLGRAYAKEIQDGKGLPRFADRLLPTKRIKDLCAVLDEKGPRLVFLGRLSAGPSALMAAAAGASEMPAKRFLPADLAGGLASIAEVITAGFLLGEAYKKAGPWLAGVGLALFVALVIVFGRSLSRTKAKG